MARDEAPPFARGETFYNGSTKDPVFSDPLNYCGKRFVFEPNSPDGYSQNDNSGRPITVVVVQNKSGINLLPKRLVRYKAAKPLRTIVDGYVSAPATEDIAGVVDEFLPAAGVPDGDFFYVIVEGPTVVQAVSSGLTSLAVGDRVEAATGTSATNADAGRINKYAGSPTVADSLALVGRSEVVQTTASADTAIVAKIVGR